MTLQIVDHLGRRMKLFELTLSLSSYPPNWFQQESHKEKTFMHYVFNSNLHACKHNPLFSFVLFSLFLSLSQIYSSLILNNPPLLNILPFFKNISFCNCLLSLHCFRSQESLSATSSQILIPPFQPLLTISNETCFSSASLSLSLSFSFFVLPFASSTSNVTRKSIHNLWLLPQISIIFLILVYTVFSLSSSPSSFC